MKPIKFPESNCYYVADGCNVLPVYSQMNKQFGMPENISCWELSDQDLALILRLLKAGQRPAICLSVIGGQPPVALWVKE